MVGRCVRDLDLRVSELLLLNVIQRLPETAALSVSHTVFGDDGVKLAD